MIFIMYEGTVKQKDDEALFQTLIWEVYANARFILHDGCSL
jgi:hypothetical protein